GVGPVLAWRRATLPRLARTLLLPLATALGVLAMLLLATPAEESVTSLVMFCLAAFVLAVVGQEFWRGGRARRVVTGESWPVALARLVGRNRRRYGGYVVHAGIAVLFVGVAASSAFHEQRDVRLSPGQTITAGDYTITYREPTARVLDDRAGTGAPISLGAVFDVRRGDKRFVARPSRNYYPSNDPSAGPVGRYFEGEATSEVDVSWGLRRDLWTAIQPDLRSLQGPIRDADRRFPDADAGVLAVVLTALAERYRRDPPPAAVRAIVSPMVVWIWIGGGIAVLGSLLALWPSPEARRRRITSLYAARLGRDLARA
ncbi:MAG: heme lyase CcmF/NrfE family subunit, partial [Thermoleophilia bacterium]|nr:heme lyase CcmF/NrfE family subunit [Thermoleophilia bacterium]